MSESITTTPILRTVSNFLWWILSHGNLNKYGYLDSDYIDGLGEDAARFHSLCAKIDSDLAELKIKVDTLSDKLKNEVQS